VPRHAVHPRRSLPLYCVEAVPEQADAQVVEQDCESLLFPCLCHFSHAVQSLGHSFQLCVGLVLDRTMFSLARALPSPASAEDKSSLFDWLIGTMVRSD
jgi:hypothetical protein